MPHFGMPSIPGPDLARIDVATSLIWGRHDLQVSLGVAEAAAARFGWPLHVIDGAGDDPALEQPEAFLAALHLALATVSTVAFGCTDRTELERHGPRDRV
jgi:pimeloyl-ACP methyl ester carboxylesterase